MSIGRPQQSAGLLVYCYSSVSGLFQGGNVFAGKYGLITPRDLFKWANRGAVTFAELAENGYMVLGERLRSDPECAIVRHALETVMSVKVSLQPLLDFRAALYPMDLQIHTSAMLTGQLWLLNFLLSDLLLVQPLRI